MNAQQEQKQQRPLHSPTPAIHKEDMQSTSSSCGEISPYDDDEDDLFDPEGGVSKCDRGGNPYDKDVNAADHQSIETASLTPDASLVLSFSNEEDVPDQRQSQQHSPVSVTACLIHRRWIRNASTSSPVLLASPIRFYSPTNASHQGGDVEMDYEEPEEYAHDNDAKHDLFSRDEEDTLDEDTRSPSKRHPFSFQWGRPQWNKMMGFSALALAVVVFTYWISLPTFWISRWQLPSRGQQQYMLTSIQQQEPQPYYSLLIKGSRLELMAQSIRYHAPCRNVQRVHLHWTDQDDDGDIPDVLLEHSGPKLDAGMAFTTNSVFVLDESVRLSCHQLDRAFHEWLLDPTQAVGFLPFRTKNGGYSLLSDAAVMVHRHYLEQQSTMSNAQLDKTCQHLALSTLVHALSERRPIALQSQITFSGGVLPHHIKQTPATCLDKAMKAAGRSRWPTHAKMFLGSSLTPMYA